MKKINISCILFLFVSGFLLLSIFSLVARERLFWIIVDNAVLLRDGQISFSSFAANVENDVLDNLPTHRAMIDLNSIVMRCTGTEVVAKENATVVRTDSDALAMMREYAGDDDIGYYVECIYQLYLAAREADSAFLYVAAPARGYEDTFPAGVANYEKSNYDRFTQALTEKGIPLLNVREEMKTDGLTDLVAFYKSDNHWTAETAFWAVGKICERLKSDYGLEFDDFYINLDNYDVTIYEKWFLGGLSGQVGRWFAPDVADDFALITPGFSTDLVVERPFEGIYRQGNFVETALDMNALASRGGAYAVYSGGDFGLHILKNNTLPDGKKVLLIRDSFANPVIPFLSLAFSEVHAIDMRRSFPEAFSVAKYMSEIKPDYVIILYTSIEPDDERFDSESMQNGYKDVCLAKAFLDL